MLLYAYGRTDELTAKWRHHTLLMEISEVAIPRYETMRILAAQLLSSNEQKARKIRGENGRH